MLHDFTPNEMMVVAAARLLSNDDVCFVGVGFPSMICNLARLGHAPDITLIYESGVLEAKPNISPLSVGDGMLCETALTTVSAMELFRYWLQGGRVTIGFLGASQIDPYGNINTTVIGDYAAPTVRLPGGGGASEIAASCGEIFVIAKQTSRTMVNKVDFVTSFGHGTGGNDRLDHGLTTKGPTRLITDMAVWEPDPETKAFRITSVHPQTTRNMLNDTCQWPITFSKDCSVTPSPTAEELEVLRELQARTAELEQFMVRPNQVFG